ncbi:probable glycosyltransferase At5g03795 [Zingiber officinale]|uniref:probable glycosyltransferase At5g03795 n=1 Tax=Zingiber officinale TaxID=94328 RepID=UPI001C4CACA3|nr:probable glycosyltransferase At5g03795 [Zingiber officinale]
MDSPRTLLFHGGGRGAKLAAVTVAVFLPLVLVSMVILAVDSKSSSTWASSSYVSLPPPLLPPPSPPPPDGGGGGGGGSDGGGGGDGGDGGDGSSGGGELKLGAPSPAPEPAISPIGYNIEMDTRTLQGKTRRDVKLDKLEHDLARARASIKKASLNKEVEELDKDYVPQGPSYLNAYAFHRSYLEMEKLFKVYVYEEGEPPLFHDGPCRSIYSSEGRFINSMDLDSHFRIRDPSLAHVFFLPFSVVRMVKLIYKPNSHDMSPLIRTISDYINVVSDKYPYWNRSLGADHFMLSCHDWGPYTSQAIPLLYNSSIRALCNANTSEGFNPAKDVSLPEINLKTDDISSMMGGPPASRRPILAFFAGGDHGPVRPLLLKAWKGKDQDVQVHEYLPKGVSYYDMMRKSKFCLCPSGYEVASPRITEAIYLGCVPVTINDHYVLPFSDVLNWKAFSVQVAVEDIPNIKTILSGISSRQYIMMKRRGELVQRHFVVNSPPKRFDAFHMILHSIWLRRLNIRIDQQD